MCPARKEGKPIPLGRRFGFDRTLIAVDYGVYTDSAFPADHKKFNRLQALDSFLKSLRIAEKSFRRHTIERSHVPNPKPLPRARNDQHRVFRQLRIKNATGKNAAKPTKPPERKSRVLGLRLDIRVRAHEKPIARFLRKNAPDFTASARQLVAPNRASNKRVLSELISRLERAKPRSGPPRAKISFGIAKSILESQVERAKKKPRRPM